MSMYLKFRIGKDKRKLVPINGFELNDADSNNPQWIQGRQNEDGGRQVFVDLEDEDGSPVNLTGANAIFKGVLPGGEYKVWDHKHSTIIDAQAGRFRYTFPKRAMAIAGSYKQAFFEIYREGSKLATLEFNFEVLADLVEENIIPSDYITPFEDLYGKLKEYLVKFNGDFEAAMAQWKKDVADLITELNADVSGINLTITEIKTQLSALEDKIKEDGLLTKDDLDTVLADFEIKIQSTLDEITNFNNAVKNLNITDVDGGIPDYMLDTLSEAQSKIDKSKFNLIFATDYHYDIGTTYNPTSVTVSDAKIREVWEAGLRKVLNATSLSNADTVVFNGDNIDQPSVKDVILEKKMMVKELQDFLRVASSSAEMPAFILKGNHDGNYNQNATKMVLNNVITDAEFSSIYNKIVPDYGEKRPANANYFYRDFVDKKVRLIGLDTYDLPETTNDDGSMKYNRFKVSGLQQPQLNWLANTALQVPQGTTVIIATHHPVNNTFTSKEPNMVINHDILLQILNDFVEGKSNAISGSNSDVPVSINYTFQNNGVLAAVLSGHFHVDGNIVKNGINFIQTRCSLGAGDKMIGEQRLTEYIGTPLEDAFDIVTIDTKAKTVDLKRVGAGSEDERYATRHFNY
ncbi:DUF2479 domain-containing protein [Pediococcus acidilactici]|uniref:BppU family phage baseplate upper protein n=1 Tax=Pediococcus acidilactici TaxID=1254 RepID=UPI000FF8C9A1|nr:BppU family phage baseplate upper protein [Pediococcus acidilactici]QAR86536.1 DUF2479 domain-containing protein [Pediococcus acidilactici]